MGRIGLRAAWGLLLPGMFAGVAVADITVEGRVHYWNGFVRDEAAGILGAWVPAPHTQIEVENSAVAVPDITTYTDEAGRYEVTFKQSLIRPDFDHLSVNVEVRAAVRLAKLSEEFPHEASGTVACYKTSYLLGIDVGGLLRRYPYNGQTAPVRIGDGETATIHVYVGPAACPDPPAGEGADERTMRITSWDYGDNGQATTVALFLAQSCRELWQFLVANCARQSDLLRDASVFYPARQSAYIFKPNFGAWIDLSGENPFSEENFRGERAWATWQSLRCTILHEYSHKLMHDVYWTLPKRYPWGQVANLFSSANRHHGIGTCTSGEMGLVEGWAEFLPAAFHREPTAKGKCVFEGTETTWVQGVAVVLPVRNTGFNIEHAWYPGMPEQDAPAYWDVPGRVSWRDEVTGRRDWSEGEVAAVLWDVYDPPGWEFMPAAQQQYRREGWPAPLRWYERLSDPKLEQIWSILLKQPECLNDEEEWEINRDSFWTEWLDQYGDDTERVHGLKAILHNREIRHTLRPEHAPAIENLRLLPAAGAIQYAAIAVREPDPEDRPYLFYNVAFGTNDGPLALLYAQDQPLQGRWQDDRLTALVRLPQRTAEQRVMILVHDSMASNFVESGDPAWSDDAATGPRIRLLSAGGNHTMAFRGDGAVWVWGAGLRGRKQPPTTFAESVLWRTVATAVPELPTILAVAAGNQHCVALGVDGSVWTWGYNYCGALGIGKEDAAQHLSEEPLRIDALGPAHAVAAGWNRSFVVDREGRLWGWGSNTEGAVGDGTQTERLAPVQIGGLPRIKAVATGARHTLAVDVEGKVWAWGNNDLGQLGDDTTLERLRPVPVRGIDRVVDVAVQYGMHSLALRGDGTVWEWGAVNGETIPTPQQVPGLDNITAIASGNSHSLALHRDGTVWAWGNNHNGELGDGTTRSRWPVDRVQGLTNVVAIAAGGIHSAAVRSDGTVWSWGGRNLGNAQQTKSTVPIEVNTYQRLVERKPNETSAAFTCPPLRLFD